ncbi:unnamed protein product [Oikopleura dioica]|uniref:Uncharacterized protein n=1 Tax=Oikopleura dioica TaxID=34765 RepID=E4XBP7_OIKDI|nr:unnamed protein product [Oikopleura dioica]
MSHHIPQDILLGIENISKSGTGATWSLTKTSQGLSFTVTYPENSACGAQDDSYDSASSTYSDSDDTLSLYSLDSGVSSLGCP